MLYMDIDKAFLAHALGSRIFSFLFLEPVKSDSCLGAAYTSAGQVQFIAPS